jgi:hypothetical protein
MKRAPLVAFKWDVYPDVYEWQRLGDLKAQAEGLEGYPPDELVLSVGFLGTRYPPTRSTRAGDAIVHPWLEDERLPQQLKPRRYAPLFEHRALYKTFADSGATPEGILAFAKKYGHLGLATYVGEATGPALLGDTAVHGEMFRVWRHELAAMRHAVGVWEKVRDGDAAWLEKRVRREEEDAVFFESLDEFQDFVHHVREPIANRHHRSDLLSHARLGNVLLAAKAHLQWVVNSKLARYTSSQMLWEGEGGDLKQYVLPNNLLGAMWCQLAAAIEEKRNQRICDHCGQWYELAPQARSRKQGYCSNSCRQKAYRGRKAAPRPERRKR